MFRQALRASSRALRPRHGGAHSNAHANRAQQFSATARAYTDERASGSSSLVRTIIALSGFGGVAYYVDSTYGPASSPKESWEDWALARKEFYGGALSKASLGLSKEYKQDVFFSYEKRLRSFSPLEKVFDYFASEQQSSGTYMTLSDLVRALLPLHPAVGSTETRAGHLHGEMAGSEESHEPLKSQLFELFDTDGNGLIDFSEFLFFHTLLTIDRETANVTFHKFDADGNGYLDADEFVCMMTAMRKSQTNATGLRTGLKTGVTNLDAIGDGLLDYLFTPKRNKTLTLAKFNKFLSSLREEMDSLEFSHYDTNKTNTLTLRDFGYSLVCQAKMDVLPRFLEAVKRLPGYESKKRIKRDDFLAFARIAKHGGTVFQKRMKELDEAGTEITRSKFKSLAKRVAGERLSDELIDVVFTVFDADGDGSLSYDEFFNALITWK
jgi:calcium uptake protein 1, mitochondrial